MPKEIFNVTDIQFQHSTLNIQCQKNVDLCFKIYERGQQKFKKWINGQSMILFICLK